MTSYGSLFAGYGGLDLGVQSVLPGELADATGQFVADFASLTSEGVA